MSKKARPKDESAPESLPAVIYAARSAKGEDQRSTDSQISQVEARIASLDPPRRVVAVEPDDGYSGSTRNRGPALERMIAAAVAAADEHGRAELWAFHSSRFGRGTGERGAARAIGKLFYDMRDRGVALRTVEDDEFVTNEMLIGFASKQASKYSEDLSAHVRRGKRAQFERGERLGAPVRDGYRVVTNVDDRGDVQRTDVFDPDRKAIIDLMFDLSEGGMGDPSIARELNRRGHRTRGRRGKAGVPWTRRRVQDTLTNPYYAGRVVINRGTAEEETRPGKHPALVEPERFDRIQAMRTTRDRARGSNRAVKGRPVSKFALTHLAYCAHCGARMQAIRSPYVRKDGTSRRTYQCAEVHGATGLCDAASVSAETVDASVIANLDRLVIDFDSWCVRIEDDYANERGRLDRGVGRADAALADAVKAVERLEARYAEYEAAGATDRAEAVMDMLLSRRAEVGAARRRRVAAHDALESVPEAAPMDGLLDFYSTLRAAVQGRMEGADSLLQVNDALRDLFERFELDALDDGSVQVTPVLSGDAALRIADATEHWQTHADLSWGGRALEPVEGDGDGSTFRLDLDPEGAAGVLAGLEEGAEVTFEMRLRDLSLVATGGERIAPPLRPITASGCNGRKPTRIGE